MPTRGIRAATTVINNSREEILAATSELLSEIIARNDIALEDIASIIFSTTRDLTAEFPAVAARKLGLNDTPLLCACEIDVPRSQLKCIRILMHINTAKEQKDIKHVYLKGAVNLRR
ncbi:MAG: chorismate mutase [Candidatus Saganbacteria bacterium]|nr:chorismate mutase [Candidatus Saganbacteria bacterium]